MIRSTEILKAIIEISIAMSSQGAHLLEDEELLEYPVEDDDVDEL